jgi:putative endonuclease
MHNILNMPLPYCVYVLKSLKDFKHYIGFTTNLKNRIGDHNAGRTTSTAPRRPFELLYCEYHKSKVDAMRREKYFKTTAGKKALKLMLRESLKDRLSMGGVE